MAAGDRFILDLTYLGLGAPDTADASLTDVSGFLSRAELVVTNTLVTTPATFGNHGERNDVALAHSWQLMLDFYTDGFGQVSSVDTIDKVVTDLMRAPLGASTTGHAKVLCAAVPAATTPFGRENPSYSGEVAINEWRPLGGGAKATAVMNNVTWRGHGSLSVTRS